MTAFGTAFVSAASAMALLVLAVLLWPLRAALRGFPSITGAGPLAPPSTLQDNATRQDMTADTAPAPNAALPASPPDLSTLRLQLRQLEAMRDNGSLSPELCAAARARLEQQIVARVMVEPVTLHEPPGARPQDGAEPPASAGASGLHAARRAVAPRVRSVRWAAGLALAVLTVVAGGYATLGQPDLWFGSVSVAGAGGAPGAPGGSGDGAGQGGAADDGTSATAPHTMEQAAMQAMVASLAERLARQPEDPEGWGMLARSYAVLGQHTQALPAFKRALAARPDDAVLLADYADALAVSQGRRIEGEPLKLVQRALAADPKNLKALSLAGTAAFDRGDYAGAVQFWERLQQAGPPDHVLVRQIAPGLADARVRAGLAAAAPATAPATAPVAATTATPAAKPAAAPSQVAGRITLAPSLAARAAPEDTVFIYARAAEGPRMPLAILRKQVKDLPLQFTLDDSLAMSPDLKLSSQRRVIVSARVSKSGQATPQPGDLVGQSAVVALGRTDLGIQIAEVVQP